MKAVVLVAMYEKDQTLPLLNIYGKNLTIKFGGVDGCDCDKIMEAYEIFENKRDGVIKIAINMKK